MKFLENNRFRTSKFWHKLSIKDRNRVYEKPDADDYKRKNFNKPKWCMMDDAHIVHVNTNTINGEGDTGCLFIEFEPYKVSNKQCSKRHCPFHMNHPNYMLTRVSKRKKQTSSTPPKKEQKIYLPEKQGNSIMYKISILLVIFWAVGFFAFHASGLIHIVLIISGLLAVIKGLDDFGKWLNKLM